MKEILENIKEAITSNTPLLYMYSSEHNRLKRIIQKISNEIDIEHVYFWNDTSGLKKNNTEEEIMYQNERISSIEILRKFILEIEDKSLFVIQNLQYFLKEDKNVSNIQNIMEHISLESLPVNIIGFCSTLYIPNDIDKQTALFEIPLPSKDEIESKFNHILEHYSIKLDRVTKSFFIESLNGLTEEEVERLIYQVLTKTSKEKRPIEQKDVDMVIKQKRQIINKSGIIEAVEVKFGINDVGGLVTLKKWLKDRKVLIEDPSKALKLGLTAPKGVFLFGMPGTGKSLISKVISSYYNLPLLKLDMGIIFGKSSPENAMREAIKLADAISPCIFWIDEVEKAMAGTEAGTTGSEDIIRILGLLLTWMQEKTTPVFMVATANDISKIRPEFRRKGRFDELFYVDFPDTVDEIKMIIELHLMNRLNSQYDEIVKELDYNAIFKRINQQIIRYGGQEQAGYAGADIEHLVIEVIQEFFFKNRESITTNDFINMLNTVKPQHGPNIKYLKKEAEKIGALKA
jgi:ATP-dependent 26S proteasome regulatory subunit